MRYTKEQVLKIVDFCFRAFASNYRMSAKEKAIAMLRDFKPQPPTLRPMSAIGKSHAIFLLEGTNGNRSWQKGVFQNGVAFLDQGGGFGADRDFKGIYGQVLGWLPALPNPNKIKPC